MNDHELLNADKSSAQTSQVQAEQSVFRMPPARLLDQRFHLITGKGGVGKSAVAMTLGLYFARHGLKTLICEVDRREMMTQAFEVAPSRSELRSLTHDLSAVSIETQSALGEYGVLKLKVKALSTLLTENPLTRALLAIVPGVADLIALGKAFNHEREVGLDGPLWDRVIVDAPSTGHGLTFMRLPQLIREVVPSGNMRREADAMWSLISDPARTVVHVVATPEEMPTQEARELWSSLSEKVGVTPQSLWVNLLDPLPFNDSVWESVRLNAALSDRPMKESGGVIDRELGQSAVKRLSRCQYEALSQREQLRYLTDLQTDCALLPRFLAVNPNELRYAIDHALAESMRSPI